MSELAFGKNVELRPHAVDRYGRTAAQVFVDGRDRGLGSCSRKGRAWVYECNTSGKRQQSFRRHIWRQQERRKRVSSAFGMIHIIRKGQAYGSAPAARGGLLQCFILGLFSAVTCRE